MPDWQPRNTARARTLRNQPAPAEQKLWQYLSNSRLDGHKFSRQMPLGPYFCDFLCRRHKLVIELDGASHAVTVETDQRRDAFMRDQGYTILRFGNADVMGNVEGVVAAIAAALGGQAHPRPLPHAGGERRLSPPQQPPVLSTAICATASSCTGSRPSPPVLTPPA